MLKTTRLGYDGRGQANETSGIKRTPNGKMIFDAVVKKDPATGERVTTWEVKR